VKVSIKKKHLETVEVKIHTEFIKLQDFLKFCDAVSSGGEAKMLVQDGQVTVNDHIELKRGKKLRNGDVVGFMERFWKVKGHEA